MPKTFRYKKWRVMLWYGIPFLLFSSTLLPFILWGFHEGFTRPNSDDIDMAIAFTLGVLVIYAMMCAYIAELLTITFTVEERGLRIKSAFKNKLIHWSEITEINRVNLGDGNGKFDNPARPKNLSIKTRSQGNHLIHKYMFNETGADAVDEFAAELDQRTKWDDKDEIWRTRELKKGILFAKVLGFCSVAFGLWFYFAKPQGLDWTIKLLGREGIALFFIIGGVKIYFEARKASNR